MQIPDPFASIRQEIVGIDLKFRTPCGEKTLLYADWTASGRLYRPIEQRLSETIGPYVGNTHSELSVTGTCMTRAYHHAQNIIKKHVNAAKDDVLIHTGFGMTAAVNKFQRLLGLKIPEQFCSNFHIPDPVRPLVLITHMEHHSNQTSWLETIAEVVVFAARPKWLGRSRSIGGPVKKIPRSAIEIRRIYRLFQCHRHPHPCPPNGVIDAPIRRLLLCRLCRLRTL